MLELLEEQAEAKESYLDLVRALCVDRAPLTRAVWEEDWQDAVVQIAVAISGAEIDVDAVQEFLAWDDAGDSVEGGGEQGRSDNVFRYPADNPAVEVRVGSIHSVKGTVTLNLFTPNLGKFPMAALRNVNGLASWGYVENSLQSLNVTIPVEDLFTVEAVGLHFLVDESRYH